MSSPPVLGATLNPSSSSTTVIGSALYSSFFNAALTLPPLLLSLNLALRNPTFRTVTGPSSRTALVVMPALFVWGLTAELEVIGLKREEGRARALELQGRSFKRVDEVGSVEDFSKDTVLTGGRSNNATTPAALQPSAALYKATVGVPFRIVPSSSSSSSVLPLQYSVLNFMYDHPFRLLCMFGLPIVAGVYSTQKDYGHLKFSQKVMQTRVLGQFVGVSLLLGLMGWTAYMDEYGRFVTAEEADRMAKEVGSAREDMLRHIEEENGRAERMRESSRMARVARLEGKGKGDKQVVVDKLEEPI